MATEQTFPAKTALALATFVAVLAVYQHFDHAKGLSPAVFGEAAHVKLIRRNPSLAPATAAIPPLNGIQQVTTTAQTTSPGRPQEPGSQHGAPVKAVPCPAGGVISNAGAAQPRPPISPNLVDDCGSLDPFFAALHSLDSPAKPGAPEVVTVLHYGDSPTTADLITGDVRSLLQQRFGDAGLGFLLTAKPWAWYQHRGVEIKDSGWKTSTAVGKGREETYGIGGASFEGDSDAATHVTLKGAAQASMEVAYLARPEGGMLAVTSAETPIETISTALDTTRPNWHTVSLPAGTRTIDLKPSSGSVRLFGETFRTGHRGVLYDSLGLNGASTTVLSNGFNAGVWAAELQHERPALVIINYGTNESGFADFVDKYYEPTLKTAIIRIRSALPGVPILIMSPMDRGQRTGVDQIQTYATIPKIVATQRKVAAEQNCAFFDTFDAMGGEGTMSRWYTSQPRLVAGDLIHPTPQGAALVANLFIKDLSLGYERYLHRFAPTAAITQITSPGVQPKMTPPAAARPVAPAPLKPTPSPAEEPGNAAPPESEPETTSPAAAKAPQA